MASLQTPKPRSTLKKLAITESALGIVLLALLVVVAVLLIVYAAGVGTCACVRVVKRTELRRLLRETLQVFHDNNIPYVLHWGTLLGAVREGRILPDDDDVDVVIFGEAEHARAREALRAARIPHTQLRHKLWSLKLPVHVDLYVAKLMAIPAGAPAAGAPATVSQMAAPAAVAASSAGSHHLALAEQDELGHRAALALSPMAWVQHCPAASLAHAAMLPHNTPETRVLTTVSGMQAYVPRHAHALLRRVYGDTYLTPIAYKKAHNDVVQTMWLLKLRRALRKAHLFV